MTTAFMDDNGLFEEDGEGLTGWCFDFAVGVEDWLGSRKVVPVDERPGWDEVDGPREDPATAGLLRVAVGLLSFAIGEAR